MCTLLWIKPDILLNLFFQFYYNNIRVLCILELSYNFLQNLSLQVKLLLSILDFVSLLYIGGFMNLKNTKPV